MSLKTFLLVVIMIFSLFQAVRGDDKAVSPLESYLHARKIVEASLDAMGGLDRIQSLETLQIDWKVTQFRKYQSLRSDKPYGISENLRRLFVIDFKRDRFVRESVIHNEGTGSEPFVFRQFKNGSEAVILFLSSGHFRKGDTGFSDNYQMHKGIPPLILLRAYQKATTLRWRGEDIFEGQTCDVITLTWDDGKTYDLYINSKTKLLAKASTLMSDVQVGDSIRDLVFSEYKNVGGILLPERVQARTGGEVILEIEADSKVDEELDESLFEIPLDWNEAITFDTVEEQLRMSKVGKGVHLVEGLVGWRYNSLCVEFKDYVMVIEAPINSRESARAIALIRETVGNKPIKYLALSHYHHDHSGGAREYIAEGAKIITTPENRNWFERMAAAKHTLLKDKLSDNPRKPEFEFVKGDKRVFSDGEQTVEFYSLGANGVHVDNLLIAYLPKDRILYVGDFVGLISRPVISPAWAGGPIVADAIKEHGLVVERIIEVHGRRGASAGTMDNFEISLKMREQDLNRKAINGSKQE